jgi:hypothetical protein
MMNSITPSYSSTAVTIGSIIFLALLATAVIAAVFAHRRPPDHRRRLILGPTGLAHELRSHHAAEELDRETVEAWFNPPSLAGFPARALDEMLPDIGRTERARLQTAWLLAAQGHDAAWLTGHFGLPSDVARLLADSAQQQD